jgi:hypothetical protein
MRTVSAFFPNYYRSKGTSEAFAVPFFLFSALSLLLAIIGLILPILA